MTRPKRLTITQLAMELCATAGKYPRAGMSRLWFALGPGTKAWWRRVARRAIRLERRP